MRKFFLGLLTLGLLMSCIGCLAEYIPPPDRINPTRQFRVIPVHHNMLQLFYVYNNFGQGSQWLSYDIPDKTRKAFAGCRTNVTTIYSPARPLLYSPGGSNVFPDQYTLFNQTVLAIGLGYMPIDSAAVAIIHDVDTTNVLEPGFVGITYLRIPGPGGVGATAYVIHDRIKQAVSTSPDSLYWLAAGIGEVVIHEMGHARGIVMNYTHTNGHAGQNDANCVMRYHTYIDTNPIFCDAHKDAVYAQTW